MTYKDNVRHGIWGIVGLLIPSLIVVAAYGVPSIVAFVAIAMAFWIGEARGKRETGDEYREALQEAHDDIVMLMGKVEFHSEMSNKLFAMYIPVARKLNIAGKKVQRLTERLVHDGK